MNSRDRHLGYVKFFGEYQNRSYESITYNSCSRTEFINTYEHHAYMWIISISSRYILFIFGGSYYVFFYEKNVAFAGELNKRSVFYLTKLLVG